jgi:hypothetical protein
MYIRKISVGTDPLKAMHYQVGSSVMNGTHEIQSIEHTEFGFDIWVKNGANEIMVWKTVNQHMPLTIEHNIEF